MPPRIAAKLLLAGLVGEAVHLRWEGPVSDLCLGLWTRLQVAQPLRAPAPGRRDKEPFRLRVRPKNLKHDRPREARFPSAHPEKDETPTEEPAES